MWPLSGRLGASAMKPSDFPTILCASGSCTCVCIYIQPYSALSIYIKFHLLSDFFPISPTSCWPLLPGPLWVT